MAHPPLTLLNTPRLDTAVFDLYSRGTLERGGGAPANRVRLSAGAPAIIFLNADGQPKYPDYAVDIIDGQSKSLWRKDGLHRTPQGVYLIQLPPGFLIVGEYRIVVSGRRDGNIVRLAEYDLSVVPRP